MEPRRFFETVDPRSIRRESHGYVTCHRLLPIGHCNIIEGPQPSSWHNTSINEKVFASIFVVFRNTLGAITSRTYIHRLSSLNPFKPLSPVLNRFRIIIRDDVNNPSESYQCFTDVSDVSSTGKKSLAEDQVSWEVTEDGSRRTRSHQSKVWLRFPIDCFWVFQRYQS